jgi:hypothetical protein
MVKTIQAWDISLYELEEKFGLELVNNTDFFPEWTENLPLLTEVFLTNYSENGKKIYQGLQSD